MLNLIVACLGIGLVVLGLHRFGRELRFLLLTVFVASVQFLQNLFLSTTSLQVAGEIMVSPGSAILFPATLLALLLVAIHDGILSARRLIYAILAANLLLALLAFGGRLGLRLGFLQAAPGAADWLENLNLQAFLGGTVLLILDAVLLIVLYETSRRLRLPRPVQVIASLVAVLLLDGILFALLTPDALAMSLPGQLIGKVISGLTYGSLLAGYLMAAPPSGSSSRSTANDRFEWMDVFSILGYRRRYLDFRDESRRVLRRTERQVELLLDSTAEAIVGLDQSGRCTLSNRAASQMLGYPPDEKLAGRRFHDLAHPGLDAETRVAMEDCPMCRVAVTGEAHTGESRVTRRSDGTSVPVEYWAHPIRRQGEPLGAVITFLDISDRRRAAAELEALERRYRELFQDAPEMYVLTSTSADGPVITECSRSFLKTLGYRREAVIGHRLADFYTEDSAKRMLEDGGYEMALAGTVSNVERELVASSGEVVQTLLRAGPDTDSSGKVVGTRAIFVNITERKTTEALVRRSRERLRRLAERLQNVREEERQSLAHEMHDELGQSLTALRLDLAWLQMRVEGQERLVERTQAMLGVVDRLIEAVGDLSARLRPHVLDTLGLRAAIHWEAQRFSQRTAVHCSVETVPEDDALDDDLDGARATALFRILQEALTNVARHAGASLVQITFRRSASELQLSVADDGKGIEDEQIASVRSSGLIGIRERVGRLAGSVEIGRRAQGGTRIAVRIPL